MAVGLSRLKTFAVLRKIAIAHRNFIFADEPPPRKKRKFHDHENVQSYGVLKHSIHTHAHKTCCNYLIFFTNSLLLGYIHLLPLVLTEIIIITSKCGPLAALASLRTEPHHKWRGSVFVFVVLKVGSCYVSEQVIDFRAKKLMLLTVTC